jgi:threonine synthase
MSTYVTHLEGAIDGAELDPNVPHTLHRDRPIWVRYDLPAVARAVSPERIATRPPTLWRYRELLPPREDASIVTLGEGMTPILPCPRLGADLGLRDLWIKDESQLPTGSFKSRGQTVAITMCKQFGIRRVAIPTAGNAGGAMAAYAARAGIEAYVFMPADTPIINQFEAVLAGAKVFLVDGLINDCGKIVRAGTPAMGWFDISTLKEPYRIEGKKTMGLELAEQSGWTLPDVILYPTGGGTGLVGMWKAFAELRVGAVGRLRSHRAGVRGGEPARGAVPECPHDRERPSGADRGGRLHDSRRDPRKRRHGGRCG